MGTFLTKLKKLLPKRCPTCCEYGWTIESRHRNSAYCQELNHLNYLTSCQKCYNIDYDLLQEQWEEYWSSQGYFIKPYDRKKL